MRFFLGGLICILTLEQLERRRDTCVGSYHARSAPDVEGP